MQVLQKINRPEVGLFFAQNSKVKEFESPLPSIFNSTFQKYFSWKFYSDLIQISKIIARHFEFPQGTDFSLKIPFQKISEFHPDFDTISQFVHILFGTISDDADGAVASC